MAGFDVFSQSVEVRRRIGYLPESNPLYPEMRVNEYLAFRGKLHGMNRSERDAAISRVTERCWLGDFIGRPIGQSVQGHEAARGVGGCHFCTTRKCWFWTSRRLVWTRTRSARPAIWSPTWPSEHTIILSSHILSGS